uniref:Uncharacterized protein n=1 Tax=Romanomermis culicivorax TaxID=13658 RepID=A0A915J4V3_ROMCU
MRKYETTNFFPKTMKIELRMSTMLPIAVSDMRQISGHDQKIFNVSTNFMIFQQDLDTLPNWSTAWQLPISIT